MHVFWFNSFPMMLRETAASMGRCSLKVETSSQHVPNLHCQHWGMDAFANIADQGFQSLARTWHVSRWNWCQWNIGEWGWWGRAIRTTDVFFSICHHLEALPTQKPWINWRFHGAAETCNPYLLGTNRSNTASAWRKDFSHHVLQKVSEELVVSTMFDSVWAQPHFRIDSTQMLSKQHRLLQSDQMIIPRIETALISQQGSKFTFWVSFHIHQP